MASPLTPDCAHCGESFPATRSDARYCGSTCRMAAWRGHLKAWRDLARRQTAAVIAADTTTLEAIAAEANRLERLDGRIR